MTIVAGTKTVRTVKSFVGRVPQLVSTTIDPAIQHVAQTALAGETLPAAVADRRAERSDQGRGLQAHSGFERALDGSYPPGSTFKVITSTAAPCRRAQQRVALAGARPS